MPTETPTSSREAAFAAAQDAYSIYASRWSKAAAALLTGPWLIRVALLLVFGLYVRTVGFAPVYDDNVISPWSSGWSDVPKFFIHDIFFDGTAHSVYYRPVAMTYGFLVGGLTGGAPGWLHLMAIFLHVAVILLAYAFGRRFFGDEKMALLTAVLFGLHPSKVESVAWIGSSCVDALSGIFFFASMIAFLRWRESGALHWLAASVSIFAVAMFTKETMLCIPILIAAYLWLMTPPAERISRILRTVLPYGVVCTVYLAIRHRVIQPAAPTAEYIHPTFTHSNWWTAPYAIWWYLGHLLLPWGLSVEYAPHVVEHPTLFGFVLPAAGVLLLSAAACWLWLRQRSRRAAFLFFWFVLTLAPAIVVAPMVLQHDRYLYLPCYAFCALIAWALLHLGNRPGWTRLITALCVVALWAGLSWHETSYWDCDKALWSRVLQISPSQPKAILEVASLYQQSGDTAKALSILDDGFRYRPNSVNLWSSRANILYDNKQFDQARIAYLKVMQLTEPAPGNVVEAKISHLRAAAAHQLARMDLAADNFQAAEAYIRTAIALDYKGVGFHGVLSHCLFGEGRVTEAKAENALELKLRLAQQANAPR
jgi:tetratricopeptide (TPR) repeat protein